MHEYKGLGRIETKPCPNPDCKPAAQSEREGWQLVPREPTEEMINAAEKAETRHLIEDRKRGGNDPELGFGAIYKAMLAAAPKPPVPEKPNG